MQAQGRDHIRLAAVAAALALFGAAAAAAGEEQAHGQPRALTLRELVERVKPAVVTVDAYQTVPKGLAVRTVDFLNPFPLRTFLTDTVLFIIYIPRAIFYPFSSHRTASGFIIDRSGLVATSYHVIDDYNRFTVRLVDGSIHEAEVAARDELADIALLKIDLSDMGDAVRQVEMGDSDAVQPGDSVTVIGTPLGLQYTVTAGVVSGVGRRVGATYLDDLIQIDAALDPGNSGGPVFNSKGKVIGIAAAHIWLAENKGFAIPINMLTSQLANLRATGEPRRGRIGVVVEDPTLLFARSRGLDKPSGALIVEVGKDSPAELAGLRRGDLVIDCRGRKINNSLEFVRAIRRSTPGNAITVQVLRTRASLTRPHDEKPAEIKVFRVRPRAIEKVFRVF